MSTDPWKAQLEALGALLRAQRKAADLTLRDLSERTKVSNAYLSQLERGLHEPSLGVLTAIASALGVPLESLLPARACSNAATATASRRARPKQRSCVTRAQRAATDRTAERVPSFVPASPALIALPSERAI